MMSYVRIDLDLDDIDTDDLVYHLRDKGYKFEFDCDGADCNSLDWYNLVDELKLIPYEEKVRIFDEFFDLADQDTAQLVYDELAKSHHFSHLRKS
jgi:hypothetical protein